MKIVFANGRRTYPLFNGGDGISIHDYLLDLSRLGNRVMAFGKINNPDFIESSEYVTKKLGQLDIKGVVETEGYIGYKHNRKYNCRLFPDDSFLKNLELNLRNNKPDILLTQLNYSHKVIEVASKLKIRVILFIHDNHAYNFLPINLSGKVTHVIFNSKNTRDHFKRYLKCPYSIIYPSIKLADYKTKNNSQKFITMINHAEEKGGSVFLEIAKGLSGEQFLLVKGWKKLDADFKKFNNIKVVERQYDMRKIYSQTKILLVPSQWEESFARVVPEAMVNKIPVIASRVGGLIESVGGAGILVDDFVNPKKWISEVNNLLRNEEKFIELQEKSITQSNKFKFEKGFAKLCKVLNGVYRT